MSGIKIDPRPRHAISPRLYMQFMEPLGATDGSVAAGWDVIRDDWRSDFIEITRDLAPGAIRWGGILTSFWKWREGVGSPESRVPMVNYLWGGTETNRVGVDEILSFCERVGAEPIMGVNFAADGRPKYIETPLGERRAGTPEEAADLVSYCNDPDNVERRANGREKPWNVRVWQIGNETSYPRAGERFTSRENAETYKAFARAMRERDPTIALIGWGDVELDTGTWWAPELIDSAAGAIDIVALHMMDQRPTRDDTVLRGRRYRDDYARTWEELSEIHDVVARHLASARKQLEGRPNMRLAITEGHLSLAPHNKNELLREWIAGVYHARVMTLYERNSDLVDIAILADFAGTTWTVNAVMLGSPAEKPYLMPVGHIMRLFRQQSGEQGLRVSSEDADIEVSASRSGDTVYLHLTNANLWNDKTVDIDIEGCRMASARCLRIAPGRIDAAIDSTDPDVFAPAEVDIASLRTIAIPRASVSTFAIDLAS